MCGDLDARTAVRLLAEPPHRPGWRADPVHRRDWTRLLAERYPDAARVTDGDATSEWTLAAMDGAGLVHVAADGTFRSHSPLSSALDLDDGPLTFDDLERLDRAPHWVVLSNCISAFGSPTVLTRPSVW
jgi:CHAT domain-containing protein